MGPCFRRDDDGELIAAVRRLHKTSVPGRADQDLVHADPRRHAGDEGDGAAEIFRLACSSSDGTTGRSFRIGVATSPGDRQHARKPLTHSSMLKEWVSASTACLVVV